MREPLDTCVLNIIKVEPISRRSIQAYVREEYPGINPRKITETLRDLEAYKKTFEGIYPTPVHMYGLPDALDAVYEASMREGFRRREQVFAGAGGAGERYARSLFIKAKYPNVPQAHRVGKIRLKAGEREIKADLFFQGKIGEETTRLLVEVKNCGEEFCWGNRIFTDLIGKAKALNAQPILVAAHLSRDGEEFCKKYGIAFLVLGHQVLIASKNNRDNLRKISESILPKHEYRLINPKRPFQHGIWPEAQKHIDTIANPLWLIEANNTWRKMNM